MNILNPGRFLPSNLSPESLRMAFPYFSIQWSTRSPKSSRHSSSTSWSFKSELDWCRHLRQRPRSDHSQFRKGKWSCFCTDFYWSTRDLPRLCSGLTQRGMHKSKKAQHKDHLLWSDYGGTKVALVGIALWASRRRMSQMKDSHIS